MKRTRRFRQSVVLRFGVLYVVSHFMLTVRKGWLTTRKDWLTIRKVTDWRLGKASDIQERLE